MLSELSLKYTYNTEEDDILRDFYIPLISNSVSYDRAVGFFSAGILANIATGLEKFIESDGEMRLIIGEPLSDEEYGAVLKGEELKPRELERKLFETLINNDSLGIKLLCYMVGVGKLHIKFAFRRRGMFHQKIGIATDAVGNKVVFHGSANETPSAFNENINSEQVSLYPSWSPVFESHGQSFLTSFENLWADNAKQTKVVNVTSSFYKEIRKEVNLNDLYDSFFESIEPKTLSSKNTTSKKYKKDEPAVIYSYDFSAGVHEPSKTYSTLGTFSIEPPKIPDFIGDRAFVLFEHQKIAIESWLGADGRGLFQLATGSGKTITSICALTKLYQHRIDSSKPTFIIISVPYIELANQWINELKNFNISAIRCYESSNIWLDKITRHIQLFNLGDLSFCCSVVVNATLRSNLFQDQLKNLDMHNLLFIGDECHHLGAEGMNAILPDAKFRLGLSATPFRSEDDEVDNSFPDKNKNNLIHYFREIVASYTLQDAISDGILSPYSYHVVPVYLSAEEQDDYDNLSTSIARLVVKSKSGVLTHDEKLTLTTLCGLRSRILATATEKIPALINYLKENFSLTMKHALFYVGEGKAQDGNEIYLNLVTKALFSLGFKVSKFTAKESSEQRKRIMRDFKEGSINGLVAMKVLDEGIDVPVCETAFILASTRNPRQYVQRRGRVLRKAPGKTGAKIMDFVILPCRDIVSPYAKQLKDAELARVNDFMNTSSNIEEIEKLIEYL